MNKMSMDFASWSYVQHIGWWWKVAPLPPSNLLVGAHTLVALQIIPSLLRLFPGSTLGFPLRINGPKLRRLGPLWDKPVFLQSSTVPLTFPDAHVSLVVPCEVRVGNPVGNVRRVIAQLLAYP